jgi:Spy/CpxP family protein refolding chaperone
MSRILASLALVAISLSAHAQTAPPSAAETTKALEEVRADLQAQRADLLAKNISLTADQASKFWPLYEKYQAEQNKIIDAQLKGVQNYAANYDKLDDASALAFINAELTRDQSMVALRRKWLPEFQKVMPATTAVRVIQIDRRLSQVAQVKMAMSVPLVR